MTSLPSRSNKGLAQERLDRIGRRIRLLGLGVAAAVLLAGCATAASSSGTSKPASSSSGTGAAKGSTISTAGVTLRIGDQERGLQNLLQAAGQLKGISYKLQWDEFSSGPPMVSAIEAGDLDLGSVGDAPPVFAAASDEPIKIVAASSDDGDHNDAIVVPKGSSIHSVAQLKGKTVAVAEGTSGNEVLLAALQHAGLTWSDITPQYLQPPDALAALKSGSIQAWAVWYPFVAEAQQEDGARILESGASLDPGYSFLVSTPSALSNTAKSAAIGNFISRVKAAQAWADAHQATWARDYAAITGVPLSVATAEGTEEHSLHYIPLSGAVVTAEQQLANNFASIGLIKKVNVSSIFDDRFSAELAG